MFLQTWLEKATFTTGDLTGGSNGGILTAGQADQFLRVAIESQTILPAARNEFSDRPSFEVPRVSLASRILRPGVEGTRLADADRVKAATGLVTLATKLFKGELPVSDEAFEDNIERDGYADTLMQMIATAVGRDIEEIVIKGDTARDPGGTDPAADAVLDQFDGLIKNLQSGLPAGQKIAAAAITTADELFAQMVEALPAKYRGNYADLVFFVPVVVGDKYDRALRARGTALGDEAIENDRRNRRAFAGIPIRDVPMMSGSNTIGGAATDYAKFAVLTDPKNIIVGWHRRIRVEKFRDPREGATSFIPSLRVDSKNADPADAVLASGIALP
jgi:hypothetical protein